MQQKTYSRKVNQFRNTAKQVNELIATNRWYILPRQTRKELEWKLKTLYYTVKNFISGKELKRIVAAASFLLGMGTLSAQTFAPPVTNPFGLTPANEWALPCFADFDSDGDKDLLVLEYPLSYYSGSSKYYQNTGTPSSPAFAAPVTNPFGFDPGIGYIGSSSADLDNDGDQDIILGAYYGLLKYYQNNGTPTSPSFGAPVINPFGLDSTLEFANPVFADLDHDGDFDLLVMEYYGDVEYFQNTGTKTSPAFAPPVLNPFGISLPDISIFSTLADVDNDGDLDLFAGSYYSKDIFFCRNTGTNVSPAFSSFQINPFGITPTDTLVSPAFADLDNDGDMDLLVGKYLGILEYFENKMFNAGVAEITSSDFNIFPNPAKSRIVIRDNEAFKVTKEITLKDVVGKTIKKLVSSEFETIINVDDIPAGIYLIEIKGKYSLARKKIVIE